MRSNRDGFAGNLIAIGLILMMGAIEVVLIRTPLVPCPACLGRGGCEYRQDPNSNYAALGLRACPCRSGRVSILACLKGIPEPEHCSYPGWCRTHSPIPKRLRLKLLSRASTPAR